MKKIRFSGGIIALAAAAVIVAVIISVGFNRISNTHLSGKMFDELSCFDVLDALEILDEKPRDKKLGSLQPVASKTLELRFEGENYKVFAYEFAGANDAFEYYRSCSGERGVAQRLYLSSQKSFLGRTEFVACYGNCAYRVQGGSLAEFSRFIDWLGRDFPIDIRLT